MRYETAQQMAERLEVTVRTVQLWAKSGRLAGAYKSGRDWQIPAGLQGPLDKGLAVQAPYPAQHTPMPLMSSAFRPGECQHVIERFPDALERRLAEAEYAYFSGQPERACRLAGVFLTHEDLSLQLSARLLCEFANLSLGDTEQVRHSFTLDKAELAWIASDGCPQEVRALYHCVGAAARVLLHLPSLDHPLAPGELRCLPEGLGLFASYILAHRLYVRGEYARSLGLAEGALAMCRQVYPLSMPYVHLVAAMNLMNLRDTEGASAHFRAAWALSQPDGLIEAFGEHHGLLNGLIETCLKKEYPADYDRVIAVTYRFSAGWRKVHNPAADKAVADNLTTTEFAVAMLASKGWTNGEIAGHMNFSESLVKKIITAVYDKLGITGRRELKQHMLC